MAERFFNFISLLDNRIGAFWIFLISASIISSFFVVVFILSLCVREYTFKKRIWFIFASASVCVAQYGVLLNEQKIIFFYFTLALSLLYSAVIFSIRVRKKVNKNQKQLIDYIDSQIRRSMSGEKINTISTNNHFYCTETEPCSLSESKAKHHFIKDDDILEKRKSLDLDFSHVKNVIMKLNYYSLSPSDRKQVKDLEIALINAENGILTSQLKEQINDGLGMLLKIMSKYGV